LTALKHEAKFIVIDTLSASIAGMAEENSNSAMSGMIANVQRLTQMTGAAVLLVHHCGNDPSGVRAARMRCTRIRTCPSKWAARAKDRYWRWIRAVTANLQADGSRSRGSASSQSMKRSPLNPS
jgi:hypothetical protein